MADASGSPPPRTPRASPPGGGVPPPFPSAGPSAVPSKGPKRRLAETAEKAQLAARKLNQATAKTMTKAARKLSSGALNMHDFTTPRSDIAGPASARSAFSTPRALDIAYDSVLPKAASTQRGVRLAAQDQPPYAAAADFLSRASVGLRLVPLVEAAVVGDAGWLGAAAVGPQVFRRLAEGLHAHGQRGITEAAGAPTRVLTVMPDSWWDLETGTLDTARQLPLNPNALRRSLSALGLEASGSSSLSAEAPPAFEERAGVVRRTESTLSATTEGGLATQRRMSLSLGGAMSEAWASLHQHHEPVVVLRLGQVAARVSAADLGAEAAALERELGDLAAAYPGGWVHGVLFVSSQFNASGLPDPALHAAAAVRTRGDLRGVGEAEEEGDFLRLEGTVASCLATVMELATAAARTWLREATPGTVTLTTPIDVFRPVHEPAAAAAPGAAAERPAAAGRLRKKMGDVALMVSEFDEAVLHYGTAIDVARGDRDFLWLAAALEGLCAAEACATRQSLTGKASARAVGAARSAASAEGAAAMALNGWKSVYEACIEAAALYDR